MFLISENIYILYVKLYMKKRKEIKKSYFKSNGYFVVIINGHFLFKLFIKITATFFLNFFCKQTLAKIFKYLKLIKNECNP